MQGNTQTGLKASTLIPKQLTMLCTYRLPACINVCLHEPCHNLMLSHSRGCCRPIAAADTASSAGGAAVSAAAELLEVLMRPCGPRLCQEQGERLLLLLLLLPQGSQWQQIDDQEVMLAHEHEQSGALVMPKCSLCHARVKNGVIDRRRTKELTGHDWDSKVGQGHASGGPLELAALGDAHVAGKANLVPERAAVVAGKARWPAQKAS